MKQNNKFWELISGYSYFSGFFVSKLMKKVKTLIYIYINLTSSKTMVPPSWRGFSWSKGHGREQDPVTSTDGGVPKRF